MTTLLIQLLIAQVEEVSLEYTLLENGPIAASIGFVLLAVRTWKSETFSVMLANMKLGRITWGRLNPAQKTGVSVIMTVVTSIAHIIMGASPWTAAVGALTTFAGAQATYTTQKQISKTVKKEYEPSISRPASIRTKPPES
jgi:hypothetical protein